MPRLVCAFAAAARLMPTKTLTMTPQKAPIPPMRTATVAAVKPRFRISIAMAVVVTIWAVPLGSSPSAPMWNAAVRGRRSANKPLECSHGVIHWDPRRYEVAGHFIGIDQLGFVDREGEVDTERDSGAERSAHRSRKGFLNGADAGRGGEYVGVSGLHPRSCGGAVSRGGVRPSERPIGRRRCKLVIGSCHVAGRRAYGVRHDVRCSRCVEGGLEISGGHGHGFARSVGESDRRDAGEELLGNQRSALTDPASVGRFSCMVAAAPGPGWAEATRDATSRRSAPPTNSPT